MTRKLRNRQKRSGDLDKLYEIEAELGSFSPEQKKKERFICEKQHLKDFWSWAKKNAAGEFPRSKLATVFHSREAMSQVAVLARIFGECREGQIPRSFRCAANLMPRSLLRGI